MPKSGCVLVLWCYEQGKVMQEYASYKVYVTLYIIMSRLSMRHWSKGRQSRSFSIAVTREVYL